MQYIEQNDQILEIKKKLEEERKEQEVRADEAERALKTLKHQYEQLECKISIQIL